MGKGQQATTVLHEGTILVTKLTPGLYTSLLCEPSQLGCSAVYRIIMKPCLPALLRDQCTAPHQHLVNTEQLVLWSTSVPCRLLNDSAQQAELCVATILGVLLVEPTNSSAVTKVFILN